MDRNIQSIHINPNFKKTQTDLWPREQSKTTHFNRHYLDELPPNRSNTSKDLNALNNRKIYVNPNFISVYNGLQNNYCEQEKQTAVNKINEKLNNEVIGQQLYKSKYSLIKQVCNKSKQTNTAECSRVAEEKTNKVDMSKCDKYSMLCQNSTQNKQNVCVQKLPLNKSRYSIVRNRNQGIYKATEYIGNICLPKKDLVINKSEIPLHTSNLFTSCSTIHSVKTNLIYKTSDKVTKVKINKYKTVSVSYLKNKSLANPNTTLKAVRQHPQTKRHSKTFGSGVIKKNKYKFVKHNITQVFDNSLIKSLSNAKPTKVRKVCNESNVRLKTKFKLNNIPCRLFMKYGKCLRQDRGYCKYVHDKKHVSLCRKFLKGICHESDCALSHELTDKKMPTCFFYLKGMCTKDNCPYLHVKLNDQMKICEEFLKGYCENGDKCSFRHVEKKPSKLLAGSKTPKKISIRSYSHDKITEKRNGKLRKSTKHTLKSTERVKKSRELKDNSSNDCRYYRDIDDNADVSCEVIKPSRCKLGSLPSFIQL